MASLSEQVKDELTCSICLHVLKEPIQLSCGHSNCRNCLEQLVQRQIDTDTDPAVECPTCRSVTAVPNNDVSRLPINFQLKSLANLVFKNDIGSQPEEQPSRTRSDSQEEQPSRKRSDTQLRRLPVCSEHCRLQEYYCRDCSELLCSRCMMAQHRLHNYEETDAVLQDKCAALQTLVPPAREAASKADDLVRKIAERKQALSSNAASVKTNISAFFDQARLRLSQREDELLSTVDNYVADKSKRLITLEDTVQKSRETILNTVDRVIKLTENPEDVSVITEGQSVTENLTTHQDSIDSISESVCSQEWSNALLTFSEDQTFNVPIAKLGTLMTSIDEPQKDGSLLLRTITDHITGQPSSPTISSREGGASRLTQSVNITSNSRFNSHHQSLTRHQSLDLESKVHHQRPKTVYQYPTRQLAVIHASILESPLQESLVEESSGPQIPIKKPELVILCNKGGRDVHPCGIAMSHNDSIVVSDVHSHSIKIFASNGRMIDTVGNEGKNSGQFRGPCALAIEKEQYVQHIYILERENRRIQKFTNGIFTTIGQKECKLGDPWGIALSGDKIFITDWQQNCIHITDRNGKYLSRVGISGSAAGIAVTRKGQLLVADQESHCVWMITQEGKIIKPIGHKGQEPGQLNCPYGIAVNSKGRIIVTESGNSRVSVFSPKGDFETCFGGKGSEEGQFNQPRHICVNSKGQIVVADEMNQRIQIFEL